MAAYRAVPVNAGHVQGQVSFRNTDTTSTGCTEDNWRVVHITFGIGMMFLGLLHLVISIHMQTENGVSGLHRFGAIVLSICGVSYLLSTGMFIRYRNSFSIHLYLMVWIGVTFMIQLFAVAIAKGQLSQILWYNIVIGVLTGLIGLIDLVLMLIQHKWGTRYT